jgi:four helix bundle protein
MHNFREIKVWQKGIEYSVAIYKLTSNFPVEEKFGLISQLRRSSTSISSNIAEGSSRISVKEFFHFLSISIGSAYESETQLIICNKLNFINDTDFEEMIKKITEIQRMLNGFAETIRNNYNKK